MAKSADDAIMDAALNNLADNGDRMDICATQPTTFTEATSTNTLGNTTLTTGAGNGDYTLADGDTSGRKVTVAAQSGVSIDSSGTADHVAISDTVNSTLKYVTTLGTSKAVSSGDTADIGAWDVEVEDPA